MHCVTWRIEVVSVITSAVRGDHRLFAYSKLNAKAVKDVLLDSH